MLSYPHCHHQNLNFLSLFLYTLRLPKSLHGKIREQAKIDEISINQFLVTAAAEKLSALLTQDYLENEAAKGKREYFTKVLKAVPHTEPEPHDSL